MDQFIVVLVSLNLGFTALLATLVVRMGGRLDTMTNRIDAINGRIDTVLSELSALSERVARVEAQR